MFLLAVVGQDLRYAFRSLRINRALTFAIVLTLTLGIGVNAAVFSLLDRLFVRPPTGVAAPEWVRRVYVAQIEGPGEHIVIDHFNYPQWIDLRGAASPTAITAYAVDSVPLGNDVKARRVVTTYVDSAY